MPMAHWLRDGVRRTSVKLAACTLVLLLVTGPFVRALTPYGAAMTPDSSYYLSCATNVYAGRGLAVWVPGPAGGEPELRPFVNWPPLYPLTLTLWLGAAESPEHAAAALARWTLFATAVGMLLLLAPSVGPGLAFVASLITVLSAPIVTVSVYAWSESLFIPLALVSALAAQCSVRRAGSPSLGVFLGALALCLGALFYVRYIGVVFAVLLPTAWLLSPQRRTVWRSYLAATSGYAAMVALLLLHNYRVAAHPFGSPRAPSDTTLLGNVKDLAGALAIQVSDSPAVLATIGVLTSAVLVWRLRHARSKRSRFDATHDLAVIASVAAGAYLVSLVALRTWAFIDRLDTRLVSPAVPFLIVSAVLAGRVGWQSGRRARLVLLSGGTLVLLGALLAQGLSVSHTAWLGWRSVGSPLLPSRPDEVYFNYTATPPLPERDVPGT